MLLLLLLLPLLLTSLFPRAPGMPLCLSPMPPMSPPACPTAPPRSSPSYHLLPQPPETRYRSFRVRFVSSIVLIVSFLTLIWAGHVPLMFMVLGIQASETESQYAGLHSDPVAWSLPGRCCCHCRSAAAAASQPPLPCLIVNFPAWRLAAQTLMVKELFTLARHAQAERKLPGFRAQQWFFFMVAAFWVYIRQAKLFRGVLYWGRCISLLLAPLGSSRACCCLLAGVPVAAGSRAYCCLLLAAVCLYPQTQPWHWAPARSWCPPSGCAQSTYNLTLAGSSRTT